MSRSAGRQPRWFIRDLDGSHHLELFLVAAVAAILFIRTLLRLTRYPQLGGGNLHIAHVLWGGLLMLVAILLLLVFLPLGNRKLASVLGGAGFGTFVDEIGKFVTRDYDYFYRPAVPIIYATLVLILIAGRAITARRRPRPWEYLLNAIRGLEEAALGDLDAKELRRSLYYLSQSDPGHPLVAPLEELLRRTRLVPSRAGRIARLQADLRSFYFRIASRPSFRTGVIIFFIVEQALALLFTAAVLLRRFGGVALLRFLPESLRRVPRFSIFDYGLALSALIAAAFALAGAVTMRRSRLHAFFLFERSLLISILLTQVFLFYRERGLALLGLAIHLLVWTVVRYAIRREKDERSETAPLHASPGPQTESSRT
jgi:hypothetical protein